MRTHRERWLRQEEGLTRRDALVTLGAAGVVAVAGGLAAREARWREWCERAASRLAGEHVPPPSGATVRFFSLRSATVEREVEYGIAWPPGARPGDALPVCFCLPGRGGGARSVLLSPLWLADIVAEAVKRRRARPFALVAVDGGESYWHRRASGEDRLAMLLDDLLPLCAGTHRLGGDAGDAALIGWSMGGYGALLAAETEPALFTCVVAVSPAVWTSYEEMRHGAGDAFDSPTDFAAHDVIAHAHRLRGLRVRLDCGTGDGFYGYATHLAETLPEPATVVFTSGGHDLAYWRRVAPAEVAFIGSSLRSVP